MSPATATSDPLLQPSWDGVQPHLVPAAVTELQGLALETQRLPLWPPWDALPKLVSLVARTAHAAAEPPRPDPADLDATASAWTTIAQRVEQSIGDVSGTARRTGDGVWQGAAGDAYRTSLDGLSRHLDTVSTAASAVAKELDQASVAMTKARQRHERALERVHRHLNIGWTDLLPWEAQDHLGEVVVDVVDAVDELCASHHDAHTAISTASARIAAHTDAISLPTTLPGGASAYDQVNASAGGPAPVGSTDGGSLRGTTAARADAALSRMTPADRAHARMLLQQATGADRRAWVLAAIGSGLSGAALTAYARQLATMDAAQVSALDPTTQPGVFVQPHDTAGASASLVMARMINHPDYAMYVATGVDPTGAHPVDTSTSTARFHAESLALPHLAHQPQQPGALPATATDELTRSAGVQGSTYRTEAVDPHDLDAAYGRATDAVKGGHAVPLYAHAASETPGQAAPHVALAVGTRGDDLMVYNPADGSFGSLSRQQFASLAPGHAPGGVSMSLPDQSAPTRAASRLG